MTPSDDPAARLTPVGAAERIELIDVLRGFAVLGILLVNVSMFFFNPIYAGYTNTDWWADPVDRLVTSIVIFVAQGKFYTLFSLLFGVGMGLQLQRAEARGLPPDRFFARRLLWLFLIGLVHAFLIWFGDILVTYAMAGFLLLAIRRLPDRWLFTAGCVLVFVSLVGMTAIVALIELAQLFPESASAVQGMLDEQAAKSAASLQATLEIYRTGGFFEIAGARAGQVAVVWSSWLFALPNILGLFAVGYVVGRRGLLRRPNVAAVRFWAVPLFVAGTGGAGLQVWGLHHGDPTLPSFATWVYQVGLSIGGPALCLFYVAAIIVLFEGARTRRLVLPLAPVGRMALTNYLMHSIVFTTLALPWGLGLYGDVPPSMALPAGIALYLLQIPLSRWWLDRYRFGPFEWLWRSLTYGKPQPMRRT